MKIRVLSDIHFEFYTVNDLTEKFIQEILPENDDSDTILIMAGDMCTFNKTETFKKFLDCVHKRFHTILYVIGNHEYYHSNYTLDQNHTLFDEYKNLKILNNKSIIINDVKFVGSTLWSDCNNKNPIFINKVEQGLNDFWVIARNIKEKRVRFDVNYMLEEFDKGIKFIASEIENSKHKTVVITHHAPSFESVDEQFKGSDINGGFGSELSEFILAHEPDIWIHGHMHNSSDYMIGGTRVIANPRGYPRLHQMVQHENKQYDNELTLII